MKLWLIVIGVLTSGISISQVRPKLRIGVVLPNSGPLEKFGKETWNGARIALSMAEAEDESLKGYIQFSIEDSQSSFEVAAEAAKRLVEQKKVDMLFGGLTNTSSLAIAEVANDTKHPFLTPTASHLDVTRNSRFVFRTNLTDPEQGAYLANFTKKSLNKKRVAIVYQNDSSYSRQLMRTFEHRFKKIGGSIVTKESIRKGRDNYRRTITALKRSRPDVVFLPLGYTETAQLLNLASKAGLKVPFVGAESWNSKNLFKLTEKYALRGHYFITSYKENKSKLGDFEKKYKAKFRTSPSYYAAQGYDGMVTIIDAYRRAKGQMSTAMARALAKTNNAPGLLGPIKLNRFRNALKTAAIFQTTANGAKFHSHFPKTK